ncbi:hypothetical protein CLV28_1532 [Sediminihabitans luteus]|uniref:Uncharacterized protein n=1 Tax=Sediminihabitans luteus TaxID=1138585 RepID=A0A2M9CQ41_9CELL|nr:hypothetical protein CLV28_1532 [Sediminihabitans luteus]GII98042.1 hypothetical protein Slu03_04200 [Sediminihabitans luteus]
MPSGSGLPFECPGKDAEEPASKPGRRADGLVRWPPRQPQGNQAGTMSPAVCVRARAKRSPASFQLTTFHQAET